MICRIHRPTTIHDYAFVQLGTICYDGLLKKLGGGEVLAAAK